MIDVNLSNLKSAGTYRFEIDRSQVQDSSINIGNMRLIPGFSKIGPVNTPVLVQNTKQFTELFGSIDRSLEKKGSFFHRTCLTALSSGPILALNLLDVHKNESGADAEIMYQPICVDAEVTPSNDGGVISSKKVKYTSCYNTDKFWYADSETFGYAITKDEASASTEILNFVNVGKKPVSFIVTKADKISTANYQITAADWYGKGNVPSYIPENAFISDYFVTVAIVEGNFGRIGDSYSRFASDVNYQDYFTEDGLTKATYDKFLQSSSVNVIGKFTGCLIPNFANKLGQNVWIEKLINDATDITGVMCYENIDTIEEKEVTETNPAGSIDIIGHNIMKAGRANVLSYNIKLSDSSDSDLLLDDYAAAYDAIIDTTKKNVFRIAKSNNVTLAVGDLIVSKIDATATDATNSMYLTRIKSFTSVKVDGVDYYEFECYDEVANLGTSESASIITVKEVADYATSLECYFLKGFNLKDQESFVSIPDGTEETMNNILGLFAEGESMYKALIDRDFIQWRYLVDSFGLGFDSNCKSVYTKLCAARKSSLAIINCPSMASFKKDAKYVDEKGSVLAEYVAQGGNPKKAGKAFGLPKDDLNGATYGAYYYPYVKVMDLGAVKLVPPAAWISNLYLNKYSQGNPWDIVAGQKRGVLSGNQLIGVEGQISHADRDYLEPAGINSLVWQNGVGVEIFANKTAKQTPKSALSSIHVREAVIYIEDYVEEILRKYLFTMNTAQTRLEIKTLVDNFLEGVRSDGGLYDYKTVCDSSNNTSDVIDNNQGVIDIYLEVVRGLEIISQRVTILRTGAIQSGEIG